MAAPPAPTRTPTYDEEWDRENAPGTYRVPEHQLFAQLRLAQGRMRPRTYQNVTAVHLLWDTHEDSLRYAPGTTALSSVFSTYGFTIRHERLPASASAPTNIATHRWLSDFLMQLRYQQGPDDLLILHYRGGAALQRFERPFRVSPPPIYFLTSETNREFDGPGSVRFDMVLSEVRMIKAQTVLLMDCDYAAGSWTGNDGVWADVLARSCNGAPGDQFNSTFNDVLVRELRTALENRLYHSVPSLYAAMHNAGLHPFATRAASAGECISNVFRPSKEVDVKFVTMTADEAPMDAIIRLAMPESMTLADEALIVQRIRHGLETLASDDNAIASIRSSVNIAGVGLVDGYLRLRMSRMLWHCLPAYRGWAASNGDSTHAEGRELWFEPVVRKREIDFSCLDDSEDEPDVIAGTPRS